MNEQMAHPALEIAAGKWFWIPRPSPHIVCRSKLVFAQTRHQEACPWGSAVAIMSPNPILIFLLKIHTDDQLVASPSLSVCE